MRIREGRGRSLFGGIAALAVMLLGLAMMGSFLGAAGSMGMGSPMGGPIGLFMIIWVLFGLIGAGSAFYNAFSKRGLPLYEIDVERRGRLADSLADSLEVEGGDGTFCPQCGQPVGRDDKFCRHCAARLS